MYISRHAEPAVEQLSGMFGAVLVAGPRQVGKTTMLKKITKDVHYATMDDMVLLASAREESGTFFKDNPPPVFVDEIQKAPELFPQIKMILDRDHKKGQFFMCGSQQFRMMKNISESLAGRIGLITLLGFSLRETHHVDCILPFLPTDAYFAERRKSLAPVSYDEVWETIHRGSMPELCENPDFDWQMFYGAYVRTYIERDVRELTEIGDTVKFAKFMTAAAASTGQLLNLASLARDVGISQPTADRWMSVLVASNLVYLLHPYSNNVLKRTIKTPKVYFYDTGLVCYLTRWSSPEVAESGAMNGALLENFTVSEIMKSYQNAGLEPYLYFYRDRDAKEIDVVLEGDGKLCPLEIKKTAAPDKRLTRVFGVIDKSPLQLGTGAILCMADHFSAFDRDNLIVPIWMI